MQSPLRGIFLSSHTLLHCCRVPSSHSSCSHRSWNYFYYYWFSSISNVTSCLSRGCRKWKYHCSFCSAYVELLLLWGSTGNRSRGFCYDAATSADSHQTGQAEQLGLMLWERLHPDHQTFGRIVPCKNHSHWKFWGRECLNESLTFSGEGRGVSSTIHSSSTNLSFLFSLLNGCICWRHYKGICEFVRFPRNVFGRSLSGTFSGDWNTCALYAYVYPVSW